MKKIKVSIIIPVYNVEKYLEQCIDSILFQKLKECEIILVDDGSTDGSGKICDKYAKKHNNIKVIHQKNKGLSGARNSGIKISNGEYLMFVDSDDFINEKINLNDIFSKIDTDILQYKWVYYYDNINKYHYFDDKELYETNSIGELLLNKVKDGSISVSACDKIVKRSIIVENDIYFKEGILSEDMEWSFRLYFHIKSLKVINEDIYIYRQQRKGSITNKCGPKNIQSLYDIINYWYHYNYTDEVFKNAYLNYLAYHYVILLTIINKDNCSPEMRVKINELKQILEFSENHKVKLCNKLFKILGQKLGIFVLKMYLELKNRGIVKL